MLGLTPENSQSPFVRIHALRSDGTSRRPTLYLAYNAYGDLTTYNKGNGAWSLTYDGLNRLVKAVDPDNVTSCTWYYSNGQVSWHESPSERAATLQTTQCDATTNPDATAQNFLYDADGNLISETHRFNNVATTTTNWYDGLDRLVEVQLPQSAGDIFTSWLTRYVYDLSNNSANGQFGDLASVQRYIPNEPTQTGTSVSAAYAWVPVKTWNYDALDRTTKQSYYKPGGTSMSSDTLTWDTTGAGLLSIFANANGDSVTYSYDGMGDVTRRDYSVGNNSAGFAGSLPSDQINYDLDQRVTMYDNYEVGPAFYTYDSDGNLATYKEPTGGTGTPLGGGITGAITDPTTYTYAYYNDNSLRSLSANSSVLPSYSQIYNYRVDGLLESQQSTAAWISSGTTYDANYAWNQTFSAAGRLQSKTDTITDPYPQGSGNRHTMAYCGANEGCSLPAALTVQYDGFGRISSWQMPEGTYSGWAYDTEGEPTGFSAGGKNFTLGYSARGELLSESDGSSSPIASYRSADGFLYSQTQQVCGTNKSGDYTCVVPTLGFDPRNGAIVSTQKIVPYAYVPQTVSFLYDKAGRRGGNSYDALNRLLEIGTQSGTGYAYGPGTVPISRSSYTYHSSLGAMPIYTTDSSNNVLDVKFGMNDDILPTSTTFSGLTTYDRDPFGYAAAARNSSGTSAWSLANLFGTCDTSGNLAGATSGFAGTTMTSCSPSGLQYAFRTDGYFDGTITFRGVRTYASDTQQWSTPDMYQGMASDPMSQMGYNYAGNNPAMFADPSGFCNEVVPPVGEPYPDPADPSCWLDGGSSSGSGICLLYCQLGGESPWFDAIGGSEIRPGVGMGHGGAGGAGNRGGLCGKTQPVPWYENAMWSKIGPPPAGYAAPSRSNRQMSQMLGDASGISGLISLAQLVRAKGLAAVLRAAVPNGRVAASVAPKAAAAGAASDAFAVTSGGLYLASVAYGKIADSCGEH